MQIKTPQSKSVKYSSPANAELKVQTERIVEKICKEAERMEAEKCLEKAEVVITPRTIQKATQYVVEDRIERIKPNKFKMYVCPFMNTISTGALFWVLSLAKYKEHLFYIIVLSCVAFGTLIFQITHKD